MYIYCESCSSWLHSECAFEKNDLALTLTPEQWKTCNLLWIGSTTTIHNSKQTLYHKVCSLHEGATAVNSVVDTDCSIRLFDESVLSFHDHDQNMVDKSVLSVPEDDKTMVDESVALGKNQAIVILKDIRTIPAETNSDSNQLAAPKNQNSKRQNISSDFASVYQSFIQQLPVTSKSIPTDFGKNENTKKIQRGLNWNTIQLLGKYNKNVENKEKCRYTKIEVEKSFVITLNEWKTKTENRTEHHFKNSFYKDVLLEKLRTLFSRSVPCVSNQYLRKKAQF